MMTYDEKIKLIGKAVLYDLTNNIDIMRMMTVHSIDDHGIIVDTNVPLDWDSEEFKENLIEFGCEFTHINEALDDTSEWWDVADEISYLAWHIIWDD